MTDRTILSLGSIWEETTAFFRAELGLVLPVAFVGFGLPMIVMLLAVPADAAETGKLAAGPWMLWFPPCGLFSLMGSLTVSALALHPGASVRECLGVAIARLPSALGLVMLNFGVQFLFALPVAIVTVIEISAAGGAGLFSQLANFAVLAATIWLFVRVMPIWALLAHRPQAPWPAARAVFALTRGQYRKLLLLRIVALVAGMIALLAMLVPIGVVFVAIGRLTGADQVAQALSFVATGAIFALLVALWTVYVARLYLRLAGSSNGI